MSEKNKISDWPVKKYPYKSDLTPDAINAWRPVMSVMHDGRPAQVVNDAIPKGITVEAYNAMFTNFLVEWIGKMMDDVQNRLRIIDGRQTFEITEEELERAQTEFDLDLRKKKIL